MEPIDNLDRETTVEFAIASEQLNPRDGKKSDSNPKQKEKLMF